MIFSHYEIISVCKRLMSLIFHFIACENKITVIHLPCNQITSITRFQVL